MGEDQQIKEEVSDNNETRKESKNGDYSVNSYKPAIHEENYKDMKYSKFDMRRHKIPPVLEWGIIISAILVIIVSGSLLFFYNNGVKDCGVNSGCFIDLANECKSAELDMYYVDDTIVNFKSNTDCILEKKIKHFSNDEPEVVKDLLKDKTMECEYQQSRFNPYVVYDLVNGIDECEGELKEAILELIIYSELAEVE